jgi:hypothetical protein
MNFVAPLALLALLALAGPLIAHALRQGRSRTLPFPAARFVSALQATTKERRRLKDPWLLAIRLLSILCLALLGATPLASCSRLSIARDRGASVAVLLVIDDSGSMQVEDAGQTRLERAVTGARELLLGTRNGDAVGIVLAGRPARLLLPPTTDLGRARSALAEIRESDRPTELDAALALAQDALVRLPQGDKQVVLLSDLAAPALGLSGTALVSTPLPALARPFENCALIRARLEPGQVSAEIACTAGAAPAGRRVELLDEKEVVLVATDLLESVQLPLPGDPPAGRLTVRLTRAQGTARDQLRTDDLIEVEPKTSSFVVGVCADARHSGLPTSGTTVLQAALEALGEDVKVDPVSVLPDHPAELEGMAALLIDDPPGLTPEAASVIEGFVRQGGVVLALLGSQVEVAPLGAVFEPLVVGAPSWSSEDVRGTKAGSVDIFGALALGWSDLPASGRVLLPEQPQHTKVPLRFADGQPLVLERPLDHGLILSTLLPSSVEVSDFALRPAFLALLDRVLYEARLRGSSAATEVGQPWDAPKGSVIEGPAGQLESLEQNGRSLVVPDRAGRYALRTQGKTSWRFALRSAQEATLQPSSVPEAAAPPRSTRSSQYTDISREIALSLLILMLLELALRAYKRLRVGVPSAAPSSSSTAGSSPRAG